MRRKAAARKGSYAVAYITSNAGWTEKAALSWEDDSRWRAAGRRSPEVAGTGG
ncbi:hypothetical protein GCM10027271_36900 [Saccharopolyspora gloriosae]